MYENDAKILYYGGSEYAIEIVKDGKNYLQILGDRQISEHRQVTPRDIEKLREEVMTLLRANKHQ